MVILMKDKKNNGFTIVELLVVLSVIALLLSIITPRYFGKIKEGQEVVLKQNLATIRRAIDQYYSDQGKYPDTLENLKTRKYLREIPEDPIMKSLEWEIIKAPNEAGIYDVKSKSTEVSSNDKIYAEW